MFSLALQSTYKSFDCLNQGQTRTGLELDYEYETLKKGEYLLNTLFMSLSISLRMKRVLFEKRGFNAV